MNSLWGEVGHEGTEWGRASRSGRMEWMTDDVRWLSDTEQTAWRAYLRGSRALEDALDADLQATGITLAEYELLSMLSEAEGHCLRMSVLADLIIQSRSRVTHTATRLARRGWVVRRPAAADGRGVELVLTIEGLNAVRASAELHVDSVRKNLVDVLTPTEFAALGKAMSKVVDHLT